MNKIITSIDSILNEYCYKCFQFDKTNLIITHFKDCSKHPNYNAEFSKLTGQLYINNIRFDTNKNNDIIILT